MSVKIARIEIKNYLGIQSLEINPEDINIFSGGNGKGKTSVIDAIQKAIYNSQNPRPKLIRAGEEEAILFIELDNGMTIERKISEDGKDKVKVIDPLGVPVKQPESFLKKLIGQYNFGFNPVAFILKSDKEQAEILLSLLPINVTEDDVRTWFVDEKIYPDGIVPPVNYYLHGLQVCKNLANKNSGWLYDKRALVNKEVETFGSEMKALQEQLPDNYDPEYWRNVSLSEIKDKEMDAMKKNQYIKQAEEIVSRENIDIEIVKSHTAARVSNLNELARQEADNINDEIHRLELQIAALKEKIKSITHRLSDAVEQEYSDQQNEIQKIKERCQSAKDYLEKNQLVDIEPIKKEFQDAEYNRSFLPLVDKIKDLEQKYDNKKYEADMWDRFVSIARQKPAELLGKVKLPVPGLGIDDEGNITINNLPIKNLSTGEQLKIALDIARVTAGEFRFICVDKYECLDEEVREEFERQIENDGFQYFITQVTSGEMKIESR